MKEVRENRFGLEAAISIDNGRMGPSEFEDDDEDSFIERACVRVSVVWNDRSASLPKDTMLLEKTRKLYSVYVNALGSHFLFFYPTPTKQGASVLHVCAALCVSIFSLY